MKKVKPIIKDYFSKLLSDKYLLTLVLLMFVAFLVIAITISLSIEPKDLKLPSRYSAFGITHFYFSQWFYVLNFIFFGFIAFILHSAIAIKILILKGRSLAIFYAWTGLVVIVFSLVVALSVINVQRLL